MVKNVGIIYGGKSFEHDISCISAKSIFDNIDKKLFNPILIGITKKGIWYFQEEPIYNENSLAIKENRKNICSLIPDIGIFSQEKNLNIDICFIIIHGNYGEDGVLQGLLKGINMPFCGSGILGSAIGMDKELIKRVWAHNNLPIVPFCTLRKGEEVDLNNLPDNYPLFIKPVNAGSSVGISKAKNLSELKKGIEKAFKFDNKIIIEKYINAREVECSVLGNRIIKVFPPGEIAYSSDFYDYDTKYQDTKSVKYIFDIDLPKNVIVQIKKIAKEAYRCAELSGFARVDFFLDKNSNSIYLNEVNTIPGFTKSSMFPKMCENAGLPYKKLLTKIIDLGFEEFKNSPKF